jgi:alpha-L-rhamnosidase
MIFFASFTKNEFRFLFRFTNHGFRYLSVFGPPNALTKDDVECPFVHSETTLKGHFATSNPIVNQIQHNIQWGQLSNIMSLPTDWFVIFIDFVISKLFS